MPEHVSDALIAPTRGGDWDDNGHGAHCTNIHGMQIMQVYAIL